MALRHARQSDRVEEEELADDRVVLARVRIRRVPRGRAAGGYDLVRQLAGAIGRLEGDRDRLAQHFCRYFDDILMPEIGRAHVCTPVTNAHLVCRLLLEKKKSPKTSKMIT